MRTLRLPRFLAVGLATAAMAGGALLTAPNASASDLPNIAEGYHNNPHAVWCVQHLINDWAVKSHVNGTTTGPWPRTPSSVTRPPAGSRRPSSCGWASIPSTGSSARRRGNI